jgi:hypothetical protein
MHQLILAAVAAVLATASQDGPDLVLVNGKFFSADPARRWAEARGLSQ